MDPWQWSVEDVVNNLCYSSSLWSDLPNASFPDSSTLQVSLRENDVNGSTLLTELDHQVLKDEFQIKSLGQRSTVLFVVAKLRGQSTLWQQHESAKVRQNLLMQNLDVEPSQVQTPLSSHNISPAVNVSPVVTASSTIEAEPKITPRAGEIVVQKDGQKRRKVLLGPSEPDTAVESRKAKLSTVSDTLNHNSYLGLRKMHVDTIFFGTTKYGEAPHPDLNDSEMEDDMDILHASQQRGNTGQQLFISRRLQYFLRQTPMGLPSGRMKVVPYRESLSRGRTSALLVSMADKKNAVATKRDALYLDEVAHMQQEDDQNIDGAVGSEWDYLAAKYPMQNDDGALPAFGEMPDDANSMAWSTDVPDEENDEESRESRRLDHDDINSAMDEALDAYEAEWEQNKRPKLECKAYLIWKKAHSSRHLVHVGTTKAEIESRHRYLLKMRSKILEDNMWTSKQQVMKQCESMKFTKTMLCELGWRLHVQEQPMPPPRILPLSKRHHETRSDDHHNNDDHIELESESDGLEDFVVQDEVKDHPPSLTRIKHGSVQTAVKEVSAERNNEDEHSASMETTNDETNNLASHDTVESPFDQQDDVKNTDNGTEHDIYDDIDIKYENLEGPKTTEAPDIDMIADDLLPEDGPELPGENDGREDGAALVANHRLGLQLPEVIDLTNSSPVLPAQKQPEEEDRDEIDAMSLSDLEEMEDRKRVVLKILYAMEINRFIAFRNKCRNLGNHQFTFEMKRILGFLKGQTLQSADENEPITTLGRLFVSWVHAKAIHMDPSTTSQKAVEQSQKSTTLAANLSDFRDFLKQAIKEKGQADRESDIEDLNDSPRRRRKRKIRRAGQELRDSAIQRRRAGIQGSQQISLRIESSGLNEDELEGTIINPGEVGDSTLPICIEKSISNALKPHQVEGIRFLWQETVIAGSEEPSGCLLAHTMGLGKTLQSIAFLLTMARAATSDNIGVLKQMPVQLRPRDSQKLPQTLILCPPSLIQNWVDEFRRWMPANHILQSYVDQITSVTPAYDRDKLIAGWNDGGGVLIMGYELFVSFLKPAASTNEEHTKRRPKEVSLETKDALIKGPAIVIADEAHKFKDPSTQIGMAVARVEAHGRIALTGSPLANNLGEYFALIDWVVPKYLGELDEFREVYQRPIEHGTYADSTKSEQRRSIKSLQALKEELEPKVHRKDMNSIKGDLPPKYEFVIQLDLTQQQQAAYEALVAPTLHRNGDDSTSTSLWDLMSLLTLLCFHPAAFLEELSERTKQPKDKKTKSAKRAKTEKQLGAEDQLSTEIEGPQQNIDQTTLTQQLQLLEDVNQSGRLSASLSAKTNVIVQIISSAKALGDRTLIFSHRLRNHDYLKQQLPVLFPGIRIARLDGETPAVNERQGLCKDFNDGKYDVMLIATRAGGLGLNLFGANRVILADFGWNPSWEEQAVGRAYRMGQRKPVFVYHLLCGGTFEGPLHQRTVFKKQLAIRTINKENVAPVATKMKDFIFPPTSPAHVPLTNSKGMDTVLDALIEDAVSQSIVSITTTDIMHVKDEELTPQELEEVKRMKQDNRLRMEHPGRWRLLRDREISEKLKTMAQPAPTPLWNVSKPSLSSTNQEQEALSSERARALDTQPLPTFQVRGDPAVAANRTSAEPTVAGAVSPPITQRPSGQAIEINGSSAGSSPSSSPPPFKES